MDGGLLQLIAKGVEDLPLIGKPEITPFKKIYRKTGLFSIMDSEVILDNISFEKIKQSKIPKLGDLISKVYLELSIENTNLKKLERLNYTDEIFIDEKYQLKLNIINKLLQIENLEELKIDDETIINLSPNSLAKNILLTIKNKIKKITNLSIDYNNNYQIISYLLASNLDDSDLIIGDFLLRYLNTFNILSNSSDFLEKNYSKIYNDLIENYHIYLSTDKSEDYQLNSNIINEIVDYLYNEKLGLDLSYIEENMESESINFMKDNLEYDMEMLKKLLSFIFPDDNFRNGELNETLIYPFFVYLYYNPNDNNKIRYNLTDETITSADFIKDYDITTITPVIREILESLEQLKVEIDNYFKSVNYQKMLGDNPTEILSILIAITEIWKWQNYDFSGGIVQANYQLVPGLEILNNSQQLANIPSFIEAISYFQDITNIGNKELNIQENITIDFERKKDLLSLNSNDYTSLFEVIDDVHKQLKNIKTFNLSGIGTNSNYLNRTSIDLSLILVYIVHLFKDDLISKNIFGENSSKSWINFLNETINGKMYAKWFSEGTSRIDENYVGPKVYLDQAGQVGLKLDDKIPLSILPNNVYQLTSDKIKNLIKLQTRKFNYYVKSNNINSNPLGNYNLKTIKKLYNLDLSVILENNIYYLVINNNLKNIWYHHFLNDYLLVSTSKQINLIYHSIRNNKIYFKLNENINLEELTIEYLKVVINNNLYLNSNGDTIILNKVLSTTSFTSEELDYNYFYKFYYDEYGNQIDLRVIPKVFIERNNNEISKNYKLENEPIHSSSNIFYINQLNLPNFVKYYDLNRDYYSGRLYKNLGSNGDTKDSSVQDNYYKFSFMHSESFVQINSINNNFKIYHLPYKINSQVYNNITIKCETYFENEKIEILGRFGNNFNIREQVNTTDLKCYSEGLDFYDINLDYLKINNMSNNEDDHLEQLFNLILEFYNNQENNYEKIVKANDIISNGLINKLLDCLVNIRNIGPLYESIIDKVLEKSNIDINRLKYYSGGNFTDNKYWCSQYNFTNDFQYIKDFFIKNNLTFGATTLDLLTWDKFNYNKTDVIDGNQYLPKNVVTSDSLNYLSNYSKNFIKQLENIEDNLKLINSYPRISNSLLNKLELDHLIKRNFSNIIEENLYEFSVNNSIDLNNPIYINNNKLEVKNNDLISDITIDDINNSKIYKISEINENIYTNNFYDFALTINNKIIFLPKDFYETKNYELLDEDLDDLNLKFKVITNDYIIFEKNQNIIPIIKNSLIILRNSSNNSLLPYGKIYPDLTNPNKFYRLSNRENKLKNIVFENNLLENINLENNIIYDERFVNTEKIINPTFNSEKIKLEYYNLNFNVSSKTFNLINELKISKFDFIFIKDKWIMFDKNKKLDINDITEKGFYIYRFLSNTIRNLDLFDNSLEYDFTNINLLNVILLCDKLEFIKVKNNKILESEYNKLKIGDFILNKLENSLHQIIRNDNNILQIYPECKFTEDCQLIRNIIFDNISEILNVSTIELYDNNSLDLQYLVENKIYNLPHLFDHNLWEFRNIKKGDLYFKNNTLELSNSNSSENWIFKSKDNFITFTNIIDNWYIFDNLNLNVGDFIYDLEELPLNEYLNNSNEYIHNGSIQSRVLGISGKYARLSNVISDKKYLVKSYPIIIKPNEIDLENILYKIDESNIILKKIDLKSVKLNDKKYLCDIESNKLIIKSGYDNSLKEELLFEKNMIYPNQNILLNNKWNSIKNFDTMELNVPHNNLQDVILQIPEITYIKNISNDNIIIDNLLYLDQLKENNKIFCSIILFDDFYLNNLTYCDDLLLEKNERNILTFNFSNNSLEEKMLRLEGDLYISRVFINVNNKIILNGSYDLINNKLYGYKSLNSEIELLNLVNNNHNHLYLGNKENNKMNLLSSQKINNNEIILNNSYKTLFYNIQNRPLGINLDFIIFQYNINYNSLSYKILEEYPQKNKYLTEYKPIEFLFINSIERYNNKYRIKLDKMLIESVIDKLDDYKIYQILNNEIIEMNIITNNNNYYLESSILMDLNQQFYQKINYILNYFKEKLIQNNQKIYPFNKYYFHYRIGFETKGDTNKSQYLSIYDFIPKQDLNEFGSNINVEVILNSNMKYYFDKVNLPVVNMRKGVLNIQSNQSYSKETKVLEVPLSDIDYSLYYDYGNFDLFPSQSDLLVYQESKNELFENLIKNELDLQSYELLEYSKENYLLVNIVNNLNWKKHIELSNNIGEVYNKDNIFNNNYTNSEDYQLYKDLVLTEDIKNKHNNIINIVNEIYNLIPQWIFNDNFKLDQDKYLNDYLIKNYSLKYIDNKFKNLDDSDYINVLIPTYFKIIDKNNKLYLEYIIKKDNLDNNFNYKLFERLINEKSSNELALKLINMIDFSEIWEKLKIGYKDLYSENDVYLSKNSINLRLEEIYRNNVIKIFDEKIYQGVLDKNNNYNTDNIFEYLVDLTELPDNSEVYYLDFKEKNMVFNDMDVEYNLPRKDKSRIMLNKYLPDQNIDLYGKIKYKIDDFRFVGNQYKITLPNNSLPNINFNINIDNKNINFSNNQNLIIYYDDLTNIDYLQITVKTTIHLKKGKYYLDDNIINWIDDNTFILIGNTLEKININSNIIISPKPQSSVIILVKNVKILSKINVNRYQYELDLDKEFNNTPALGYEVMPKDLSINNIISSDYQINNKLYITFDEKIDKLEELVQSFKINYQNKYEILSSDKELSVLEFGDISSANMLNNFYINISDKFENELGNYIYKIDILSNQIFNNKKVYYMKNNKIELLGKLIGKKSLGYYLITIDRIDYFNYYQDIKKLITLDINENLEVLSLEYLMKNNVLIEDLSYKLDDLINSKINFDLFNVYLEEEIVLEKITNQIIKNLNYSKDNLEPNKNYEKYENYIITENMRLNSDFGYDIVKSMRFIMNNSEVESFDNKMFRDYIYYNIKKEKQDLYNKMLNNQERVIIPLPFWFCRDWKNSLPIVLANEVDFYFEFNFNKLKNLIKNTGEIINRPKLRGKLVYQTIWLGDEEKELMSRNKQDYLIETYQKSQIENIYKQKQDIDLKFKGAVKDFYYSFYINDSVKKNLSENIIIDQKYNNYKKLSEDEKNEYIKIIDSKDFRLIYNKLILRYLPYCDDEYYIGYLILENLRFKTNSSLLNVSRSLAYYFSKYYLESENKLYHALKESSLILNSYQHIRNKSNLFWSCKNQLLYKNSGDLDLYGYSYALHPLEGQPSGYVNHNLIDSKLIVNLEDDYYKKMKENGDGITLELYYRKYRLIRFMGNQAGLLF